MRAFKGSKILKGKGIQHSKFKIQNNLTAQSFPLAAVSAF